MTRSGVAEILGPGGALARSRAGWEARPQQLEMAHAVAAALDDRAPLLVEAGTGTGKTLAYLVPAILSRKRVVVSTASKNLQEQISGHDLPLLQGVLPFTAAVLKGVSNYLCLRRYAEADGEVPRLEQVSEWLERTVSGDRAELAGVPEDDPVWRHVTTTSEARLGPGCPFFERCFVTNARRAAAKANLVIVNHHLLLADAALRADGGTGVLPEHDALILDEAHALEDVATDHFGVTVSTGRVAVLARDAGHALGHPVDELTARADGFFAALRERLGGVTGRASLPADVFEPGVRQEAWFRLDTALEALAAHAERRAEEDETIAAIARRAQAVRADLATIAEGTPRHVRWYEGDARSLYLHASPVEIGALLKQRLVDRVGTVVFTSATLTAAGSFEFVRSRLGLEEDAARLSVASPFDYATQALLYLPQDLPRPDDPGFPDAAVERMAQLTDVTRGRALLLFTSWRALRHAAAALRGRLAYPVRVQGDGPRHTLLDAFRNDVGSVLLATSSFWEGVDVPGEALSLVVVDKLPFQPPDDPLAAARAARLVERGEDPFLGHYLPRAAIALKQAFGRLIRRRDDRGIVAVLDGRILSRGYGRDLLATLPPAGRTSSFEQVRRFWERGRGS